MLQGHGGTTHASDLRPSHGRTWMWTATALAIAVTCHSAGHASQVQLIPVNS